MSSGYYYFTQRMQRKLRKGCKEKLYDICIKLNEANMAENELSYKVIGAAIELHKAIGPGLSESAYENALAFDLREIGFDVKQHIAMPFIYKDVKQDVGYRLDLLINDKVIIEIKSV